MKKTLIRVIKQKDLEAAATAKILNPSFKPSLTTPDGIERAARHSHREVLKTISDWIQERDKNNRAEEIDDIRKFFGSELRLDKI